MNLIKFAVFLIVLIGILGGLFVLYCMTVSKNDKVKEEEIRLFTLPSVDKIVFARAELFVSVKEEYIDDVLSSSETSSPYVKFTIDGEEYISHSDEMVSYVRRYAQNGMCKVRITQWEKTSGLPNVDITVSYYTKQGKLHVIHH